nr:UV-stimulated scaffold protein A [Mirounga angustirostris]
MGPQVTGLRPSSPGGVAQYPWVRTGGWTARVGAALHEERGTAGPGEASRACPAQPAGAGAVPGNDEAWQAPRPAPGGVLACTATAPELTASRSGADSRGRPTGVRGRQGPACRQVRGPPRKPPLSTSPNPERRAGLGPGGTPPPPPPRPLGPSGQRAARGGAGRRGLRRPREKRAPAPTLAIPACLLRSQGPGIPHSWATAPPCPGTRARGSFKDFLRPPASFFSPASAVPTLRERACVTAQTSAPPRRSRFQGAVVAALTFVPAQPVPGRANDCGELGHVIGAGSAPEGEGRGERPGTRGPHVPGCRGRVGATGCAGGWGGAPAGLNDAPPCWQLFTRAGIHGGHLEAAIDLKTELERALRQSEELDIKPEEGRWREVAAPGDRDEDEDEDDGDFVEVPEKEGYEACIPDHLRPEYGLEKDPAALGLQARKMARRDEEARDPTSAAAQLHQLHGRLPPPPSPRAPVGPDKAGKLAAEWARAPVVPFGVDLCYWGQEQPMAGRILKRDSEHRFWKPSEVDAEVGSASVPEMPWNRCITFAGRFEPVRHQCRAPRPDGRLCERQDRLKCPFHGKIVPRDEAGRPLHPEDRAWEQRQQLRRQAGRAGWQDPEFMRDVEAATGVDLGSSGSSGRGKGKRRKHPGLTDLKQQADTARARIAKKVFAKTAVQRVVTAMNQMDRKKHEKFANQFNYALT